MLQNSSSESLRLQASQKSHSHTHSNSPSQPEEIHIKPLLADYPDSNDKLASEEASLVKNEPVFVVKKLCLELIVRITKKEKKNK